MFKFIKNLYTVQTDSAADFVLSMILWIVTVIGIPYEITSILRQFTFSYKTQVNIAIGFFVSAKPCKATLITSVVFMIKIIGNK